MHSYYITSTSITYLIFGDESATELSRLLGINFTAIRTPGSLTLLRGEECNICK